MVRTVQATFDGEVFRPDEPLPLKPNARVRLTIEDTPIDGKGQPFSFLDTAESLELEGPADWSERFEDYLYGNRTDGPNLS
jgi:hypothetical protein